LREYAGIKILELLTSYFVSYFPLSKKGNIFFHNQGSTLVSVKVVSEALSILSMIFVS